MERSRFFFSLATLTCLLGGCVYVPPPEFYGGPPPPPAVPPPYFFGEPGPPDPYYGRRKSRRDYETEFAYRPRGRTQYLREVDPAYAVDDPVAGPEIPSEVAPTEDEAVKVAPSRSTEPSPAPPPEPPKKIDPATVPYATKTNTPGRAKSPYPPHRELDVSGMKSGSMAKDPTTGKVFRVP